MPREFNPSSSVPISLYLISRDIEKNLFHLPLFNHMPILFENDAESKLNYQERYFILEWEDKLIQKPVWLSSFLKESQANEICRYLNDRYRNQLNPTVKQYKEDMCQIQIEQTKIAKFHTANNYPDQESTTLPKASGLTIYQKIESFTKRLVNHRISRSIYNALNYNRPEYYNLSHWESISNQHKGYIECFPFRCGKDNYYVRFNPHPQGLLSDVHVPFNDLYTIMTAHLTQWRNTFYQNMINVALVYKSAGDEAKPAIALITLALIREVSFEGLMVSQETLLLVAMLAFSNVLNKTPGRKVLPASDRNTELFKFFSSTLPKEKAESLRDETRDILVFQ